MMLKNIIATTVIAIVAAFTFSHSAAYAQSLNSVTYDKPVLVTLTSGNSVTFGIQGVYELQNKSTKETILLYPGISLSAARDGQNVILKTSGKTYSSASGFTLQELSGTATVSTFSRETDMKKSAQSTAETVATFYPGEAVIYLDRTINNQGETWFQVNDRQGRTGWVPAQTTFAPKEPPTLSLSLVNNRKYRGSLEVNSGTSTVSLINRLDMQNYLKGVIAAEMPASWHIEALKAQAISARSFALNSMTLSNTTASQVYQGFNGEHPRANQAVDETNRKVVTYNGKPIQTFFYSTSGGRTANVGDVWNSNQASFPYLISVEDPYENSPHSLWTESLPTEELLKSLGFSSNAMIQDIQLTQSGANKEVKAVSVMTSEGTKTVTGNELQIRKLFPVKGQGYTFLRSNWFDIHYPYTVRTAKSDQQQFSLSGQKVQVATTTTAVEGHSVQVQTPNGIQSIETTPAALQLTGKGFGHRIGMSQYGAKGLAENGYSAEQIISHYYPGTKMTTY